MKRVMINFDYTNEIELVKQLETALEKLKSGTDKYSAERNCGEGNRLHIEIDQWYVTKRDYIEKRKEDHWVHLVKSRL